MAFAGKWETETQEGYDEFCKLIGVPDDVIERCRDYNILTDIIQNGDEFTWTQTYPNTKHTYNFIIGNECDFQTIGGKSFKGTVYMEGGKLTITLPKYNQVSEISEGKLVENYSSGSTVLKRTSRTRST